MECKSVLWTPETISGNSGVWFGGPSRGISMSEAAAEGEMLTGVSLVCN